MRTWRKEIYALAALIVLLVFGLAFCLAYLYAEHVIVPNMQGDLERANSPMLTLLTLKLLEDNTSRFCAFYRASYRAFDEDTWRLGGKLEMMEAKGLRDDDLKRKYFELEMRDYLLALEAKRRCGMKTVLILYFYSNKGEMCKTCWQEGQELTAVREELKRKGVPIRIFSFDGTLESPVVTFFKQEYNITSYPTLVINGEVIRGFTPKAQILAIINQTFGKTTPA